MYLKGVSCKLICINKIENLQLISQRENVSKDKKNTIGFTGVSKSLNKFRARIRIDGKMTNLGTYNTAIKAHNAYQKAIKNPLIKGVNLLIINL